MRTVKLLLLSISALVFFSCSMDYGDIQNDNTLGDNVPDSIIRDFLYTSVDNGNPVFRIYAEESENYSQKNENNLKKVIFQELNNQKEIITEGTAEKGIIFTKSNDAELSGSIIIYSVGNQAEITSNYLYWKDSEKILLGSENGKVKIRKDSGTEISGQGFTGDLNTKTFSFENFVRGVYNNEDN